MTLEASAQRHRPRNQNDSFDSAHGLERNFDHRRGLLKVTILHLQLICDDIFQVLEHERRVLKQRTFKPTAVCSAYLFSSSIFFFFFFCYHIFVILKALGSTAEYLYL